MFGQPRGGRRVVQELVAKFREKGATSPEAAMTAQELGLGPRFEEAMGRRLGATGILVAVGGKYYLDEAKLQRIQQERGGGLGPKGGMFALRVARVAVGLSAVVLAVSNILFVRSGYLTLAVVGLTVLWALFTVIQMVLFSRARRGWGAARTGGGVTGQV